MTEFSFIIPVYNCAKEVIPCVDNLLKLNRDDIEIILINDGSSDNTSKVCESIIQKNRYVSYYYQKNGGVSSARNKGIKLSKGKYIIFVDADDTIDTANLGCLLDTIKCNNLIDIAVFGLSFDYYHKGKLYRRDDLESPISGIKERSTYIQDIYKLFQADRKSVV